MGVYERIAKIFTEEKKRYIEYKKRLCLGQSTKDIPYESIAYDNEGVPYDANSPAEVPEGYEYCQVVPEEYMEVIGSCVKDAPEHQSADPDNPDEGNDDGSRDEACPAQKVNLAEALQKNEAALNLLNRYEIRLERMLFRALHELQRLQYVRLKDSNLAPPPAMDLTINTGIDTPLLKTPEAHL